MEELFPKQDFLEAIKALEIAENCLPTLEDVRLFKRGTVSLQEDLP